MHFRFIRAEATVAQFALKKAAKLVTVEYKDLKTVVENLTYKGVIFENVGDLTTANVPNGELEKILTGSSCTVKKCSFYQNWKNKSKRKSENCRRVSRNVEKDIL